MDLEIVKYRTNNKEEFLGSIDADWLSELINKSNLDTFSEKYKLPETGRNLLREVDYENLTEISN